MHTLTRLTASIFICATLLSGCGDDIKSMLLPDLIKLAESGNVEAQGRLGDLYRIGKKIPRDYAKSAQWYQKAAAQGLTKSQFHLALFYIDGKGVPKDYAQAYIWFSLAAMNEHKNAIKFRNGLEKTLKPDEQRKAQKEAEALHARINAEK